MAEDPPRTSGETSRPASPSEDAETKATRKELRQTAISEKKDGAQDSHRLANAPKLDPIRPLDASGDAIKEQVSSPKKKRAHDQLDETQEASSSESAGSLSPKEGSSRTDRLEPEKKRARDELAKAEAEDSSRAPTIDHAKAVTDAAKSQPPKDSTSSKETAAPEKDDASAKTTSASAFAKSGFAKLSGAASPFGTLGSKAGASPFGSLASAGSKQSSGFGGLGSSTTPSPFGALGAGAANSATTAPKLSFAPASTGSSAASPFASLNGGAPKTFGSAFGSGFGGGFGGPKLTSFAKHGGGVLKDDKPARPFGAPDSDNESSDNEDNETETADDSAAPDDSEAKEDDEEAGGQTKAAVASEDKKKPLKLQKVVVDDGEAGEATIFLARAKVYHLDKGSGAWKERGAGILKVNVPEATIDFDPQSGAPMANSFDASVLQADEGDGKSPKVVRLIMRQDHTLRVVLNTAVLVDTDFKRRETMKAVGFLFTALEGPDATPVTLQVKMSVANADVFEQTIELIQRELKTLG